MASNPLPFVPYKSPVVDESGLITQEWSTFLRGLYIRVGQSNALTNIELASLASSSNAQALIAALTVTVNANQAINLSKFNDLGQGPVL